MSTWSSRCRINWVRWPYQNKAEIYGLLFRASADTLLQAAADPKHLGTQVGFFSVLAVEEFLRRFLLHVLPRGFVRIRHFGFFAHRRRATLLRVCRQLLAADAAMPPAPSESTSEVAAPLWLCPRCGGPMVLIERLTPTQARLRSPPRGAQLCP